MKELFYQTTMNAAATREGEAVRLLPLSARARRVESFSFGGPDARPANTQPTRVAWLVSEHRLLDGEVDGGGQLEEKNRPASVRLYTRYINFYGACNPGNVVKLKAGFE